MLARQVPGAAGGGYTTDRTILLPGRYYIRTRSGGFYAYAWEMSVLQSVSSYWIEGASAPPPADANEPNNEIATGARSISITSI